MSGGKATRRRNRGGRQILEPLAARADGKSEQEAAWERAERRRRLREKRRVGDKKKKVEKETEAEEKVPPRLARKILAEARAQQDEIEGEQAKRQLDARLAGLASGGGDDDEVALDVDVDEEDLSENEEDYYAEEVEIDEADEKALELFMAPQASTRKTLGDYLLAKLREVNEAAIEADETPEDAVAKRFDARVVKVYRGVGKVLSRYRSGKLPRAFTFLPTLTNWEEIVFLTRPHEWTPAATYQATKIFVSSLKENLVQHFFSIVLVEKIRENLELNKKLDYWLFQALRKSCFKPGAFYKGIVLPMLLEGDCTVREATVLSSVVGRTSLPVMHSCAALLKLAEMPFSPPTCIIIKKLLDKRYSIPYRVIDALVDHFDAARDDHRSLPVLWHSTLLRFIERYKADLTSAQKERIKTLLRVHTHAGVTPEIRRELFHSGSREDKAHPGGMRMHD